jgi:anti-sigma B factor antagonist
MEINEVRQGSIVVLAVRGSLDATTSAALEKHVAALLEKNETRLIFDLEELSYISSAGLRVLVSTAKRLKASSGALALCGLCAQVRKVLDLTGFSSFLNIHPTREDSLAALGG